jgi:hypothetical protein
VNPKEFETVLKRFSKEELSLAISEIVERELRSLEAQLLRDGNNRFKVKHVLHDDDAPRGTHIS